jgi:dienelactone hydrolase
MFFSSNDTGNESSMKFHAFQLSALLACLFFFSNSPTMAQTNPPQLLRAPYQSTVDNLERDYFLYLPKGYTQKTASKWPVLIFLHGDGQRGDGKADLDFVLDSGPLYEAWIQKRDLPFIMIVPQLPMFGLDGEHGPDYLRNRTRDGIPRRQDQGVPPRSADMPARELSGPMRGAVAGKPLPVESELALLENVGWRKTDPDLINILDSVLAAYRADPQRVYLTGSSMGGSGVNYFASEYPDRFAAILSVVGFPLMDQAEAIARARIPAWYFSGGRDPEVKTEYFFATLNRMEELGSLMRFTTEQDMFHDVWNRVFARQDVYDWLLQYTAPAGPARGESTESAPFRAVANRKME